MEYLYRGVSEETFKKGNALIPKGKEQESFTFYGVAVYDSGETYGKSKKNAIILHQRDSNRFPTAFISTTPHYERAKYYALQGGKATKGRVYKIDCSLLGKYEIKMYKTEDFTSMPQIPEDNEILLVTKDNGKLPEEIVAEIQTVEI